MTVAQLLENARRELSSAPFAPSRREANLLLGQALGWSEAQVLARSDASVSPPAASRFRDMLERRLAGEPVAYILGHKEFFGRPFVVDSRVLVPRPESEHLIEVALGLPLPPAPHILDLATGSGCLAVTLACELPAARIVASDLSVAALSVARLNCLRHHVSDRITLVASDLARSLTLDLFDLVLCNPPYVDPLDKHRLSPEIVAFEPAAAVFAPHHGFYLVERLVEELEEMKSSAILVLEIGSDQAPKVRTLLARSAFHLEDLRDDLAGLPRVVAARRR